MLQRLFLVNRHLGRGSSPWEAKVRHQPCRLLQALLLCVHIDHVKSKRIKSTTGYRMSNVHVHDRKTWNFNFLAMILLLVRRGHTTGLAAVRKYEIMHKKVELAEVNTWPCYPLARKLWEASTAHSTYMLHAIHTATIDTMPTSSCFNQLQHQLKKYTQESICPSKFRFSPSQPDLTTTSWTKPVVSSITCTTPDYKGSTQLTTQETIAHQHTNTIH
jgi:hypothetical protein